MQIKGETREGRKQMTPISKHSEDQNMTKDIRLEGNQKQKIKKQRQCRDKHKLTHINARTQIHPPSLMRTRSRTQRHTFFSARAGRRAQRGSAAAAGGDTDRTVIVRCKAAAAQRRGEEKEKGKTINKEIIVQLQLRASPVSPTIYRGNAFVRPTMHGRFSQSVSVRRCHGWKTAG